MTARPTPEFRRRHDVEPPRVDADHFRQAWLVKTRVDQLRADDRISRVEWQIANEYRQTWAIARELASIEPGMLRIAAATSADAAMIARLDAATRLRVIEDTIGTLASRLLLASVVHDLPWAAIARACHRNPQTVRDWTVLAIRTLAVAWAGAGRVLDADPLQRRRQDTDAV